LLPGPSSAPPLPWRRRLSPVFSHAFTHEYYVSCTRIHNIHPKFFITLSSLPNFPLASSIHISPLLSSPPAPQPLPACQAISCSNPCMLVHCPDQTHAHSKQTHAVSQHTFTTHPCTILRGQIYGADMLVWPQAIISVK
jgi:hypothetical protein